MRSETHQQHYCGIELHARTMYVCILDREGQVCDPIGASPVAIGAPEALWLAGRGRVPSGTAYQMGLPAQVLLSPPNGEHGIGFPGAQSAGNG